MEQETSLMHKNETSLKGKMCRETRSDKQIAHYDELDPEPEPAIWGSPRQSIDRGSSGSSGDPPSLASGSRHAGLAKHAAVQKNDTSSGGLKGVMEPERAGENRLGAMVIGVG